MRPQQDWVSTEEEEWIQPGHSRRAEAVGCQRDPAVRIRPARGRLYAGKDDAGALDAYLHAYNPAFLA